MRHVSRIKESVNNLTDILNDFLSVSKLEEGRIGKPSRNNKPKKCHKRYSIGNAVHGYRRAKIQIQTQWKRRSNS